MKKRQRGQDGVPGAPAKRRPMIARRLMFGDLPRWKCWCYRAGFGIPLVLVLVLVILTQTVLLKRMVLPALEAELGLQIDAGWVYVGRTGDLMMRDVRVRTPAVPGPAGTLVQVGVLRAHVDWWSVFAGRPRLIEVRLVDPLVRLSQSVDDETLNLAGLPKPAVTGGGAPVRLPRITGTRIALELGEHQGATYTILKRLNIEGSLVPTGSAGVRQYDVRLHEINPRRGRPGITVSGLMEQSGMEVEMTGLALDDWPPAAVPTPVREWFRRLNLRGDVASTRFVARDGRWSSARLELADVGVNLLLPEEQKDDRPVAERPPLRMSGVSGNIEFTPRGVEANLRGKLEDLPYTVTLRVDGLSPDAPFRMDIASENFQIARNPDLLPYAPALVRKRFRSFSSPTGEVDTRMSVTRGPPSADGPAPIRIGGLVNFSHVDAAYDKFPYRFQDLSGVVRFDDLGIDLVQVSGTAPSGAKVLATGRIAPPNSDAEVILDIDVTDMPLDERVEEALGPQRGELLPALFSREKYKALVDSGLVLTPARAEELRRELEQMGAGRSDTARAAEIERQLGAPVFALGGIGRVHVNLHRPRGEHSDWFTTIDVHIPEAGLLVEAFPLPILARDVSLHIDDDRADLTAGTFRALSGGSADITMAALLHDPATGEKDFRPDVHVTARDVPVDGLFLSALPRGTDIPGGRGLVQSILGGLGIEGLVDATAHVVHRPGGPLGFDVHVDLGRTEMRPAPGVSGSPLRISGISGAADVSEERLDLALQGSLRASPTEPGDPDVAAGQMGVSARVTYTGDQDDRHWSYDTAITGIGLDASAPVEDLVRAFSDSTADAMAAKRAELRPIGIVDAATHITGSSEAPVEAEVTVTRAEGMELNLFGARAGLQHPSGTTVFRLGATRPVTADFRDLRSALTFDGDPAGALSLGGIYDFGTGAQTDLAAEIESGRFESAFTRRLVDQKLGAAFGAWWDAARPRGLYDQRFRMVGGPDSVVRTSGDIVPHSFAFSVPEAPGAPELVGPPLEVALPAMQGVIRFDPEGGEVVGLAAHASDWSFAADGRWTLFAGGDFSAGGSASMQAAGLPPDLRAILPAALRDALSAMSVRVDGPLQLENGRFSIARRNQLAEVPGGAVGGGPEQTQEQTADYSGVVKFQRASLEAGLKVSDMDGSLEFEATQPPDDGLFQYGLKVKGDRLTAAGVRMTDGRARIISGDQEGEVIVPLVSARSHGGRVVGQGHSWLVGTSAPGLPAAREFETTAQWSGLRFSPVMTDLAAAMAVEGADAAAPPPDDDLSRGIFEGEVSLAGTVDNEASRRGRGTMRISGGRVLKFPLVLQLIEVTNLAPPVNAALDFARVSMVIDGREIVFEDVSIFSSAVSILGYGKMSWPEMELDLRFRSKAAKPIPIISQLLEGLRDELIGTSVKGTLSKPVVSLQQFPETRRLIDRAMGQSPSGSEREMDEIQRRARRADTPTAPGKADPVSPSGPDGER